MQFKILLQVANLQYDTIRYNSLLAAEYRCSQSAKTDSTLHKLEDSRWKCLHAGVQTCIQTWADNLKTRCRQATNWMGAGIMKPKSDTYSKAKGCRCQSGNSSKEKLTHKLTTSSGILTSYS